MSKDTLNKILRDIFISSGYPVFKSGDIKKYASKIENTTKAALFESLEGLALIKEIKEYRCFDVINAARMFPDGNLGERMIIKGSGQEYNYETGEKKEIEQSVIVISKNNQASLLIGNYETLLDVYKEAIKEIEKSKE